MKYYELTKDEQEILEDFERGEFKSVSNLGKAKEHFSQIAKNTLNKARNINIRLSERDLAKLKRKAIEEGIPYQTLVSSILHKFAGK
jgi:predicted DNA binding CopG/RHH family protein